MQLPYSIRDSLVSELDEYLEAFSTAPDPEAVASFVVELLEQYADDAGIDDIVGSLEEEAALDASLQQSIEEEIQSNDEFECTGEEVVSLIERLCGIEWEDDESGEASDEEDEEEEEEEEL